MSAVPAGAGVVIRGTADPAEVAVVLALLAARRPSATPPSAYEIWRAQRLDALRHKGKRRADGL